MLFNIDLDFVVSKWLIILITYHFLYQISLSSVVLINSEKWDFSNEFCIYLLNAQETILQIFCIDGTTPDSSQ